MEENNKQPRSIWGAWWEPIRKWFYPGWLVYEITVRFYEYTKSIYHFFTIHQDYIAAYIGKIGTQILTVFSSSVTFAVCTAFLTIPACFAVYHFFKTENLTGSPFEEKFKPWL